MRRGLWAGIAGGVVVATVTVLAVVWPGLDAQRTPETEPAVWALQTGERVRYARVNTALGELDTVRTVLNPSGIAQSANGAYLFAESDSRVLPIDAAMPIDYTEEAQASAERTPAGTVDVITAGDFVAYRTDTGAVFVGTLGTTAVAIDPFREDESETPEPTESPDGDGEPEGQQADDGPEWIAEAITIDAEGHLYGYSAETSSVVRYDVPGERLLGEDDAPEGLGGEALALTTAGDDWVLVDGESGEVWRRGESDALRPGLDGEVVVGQAQVKGDVAYVADDAGLIALPVGGEPERVFEAPGGAPVRPVVFNGEIYGAWLDITGGTLWRARADGTGGGTEISLDYGGLELAEERDGVFTSSGSRMILNETRSGWVWTMPDGELVPSSQDWEPEDDLEEETVETQEQAEVVTDPRPPVAEDDAFGVRAGTLVSLPVMLNDHDPNQDVLTIMEGSVSGLPEEFGRVSITDGGGRLAVDVAPGATGSATFRYQVVDGTQEGGRASESAEVTLTVADGNRPPAWCAVAGCLAEWPSPEVAPGGTITVPVLDGWVDPEGDPVILLDVENPSGNGSVAATPQGEVVYQHSDSSAGTTTVDLRVTVADTHGARSTASLAVTVDPSPQLKAESFAVLDSVGTITVDVEPHVSGTAGRLSVESVRVLDDADATAAPSSFGTAFDFTADEPGVYLVRYTVSDGQSTSEATARLTLLDADAPAQLATAPITAFVHQGEDITLDVMEAVSNPTRRVLMLSDPQATPADGSTLHVDAVGQSALRLTGTTADGEPGLLGHVRYTVGDGTRDTGAQVTGEVAVFLLPPASDLSPVAVDDAITVRVGSQVDIPVLDNDVAAAGRSLMLDPSSIDSSTDAALAFASGSVLRYLAPSDPGEYRVDYAAYAAGAPSLADTAAVTIRVVGDRENRAPTPPRLEGRVLAGQAVEIPLETFGADPDGDTVDLDQIVTQPDVGSAAISADGDSIIYTSAPGSFGQVSFTYQVVDGHGETGIGGVRVGVSSTEADPRPVLYTDYVQVQGAADAFVNVEPLANDIDPLGGDLELTNVVPDVPATLEDGGENPRFVELADRLEVEGAQVRIAPGEELGTLSYLYDVQTSSGNSARGRIVVYVAREEVPDYPIVADTRLTAETRETFETGVDVVDGSVSWSGGDVDDLQLSLWGQQEGVEVSGDELSGELPAEPRIIPFQVSGVGASGDEVASFGFLRVPGDRPVLAERADAPLIEVEEESSVEYDLADRVVVPRGEVLQVGAEAKTSGARPAATCTIDGTVATYTAGAGAPWSDGCSVQVRLEGDEEWTVLTTPIRVIPVAPQPDLQAASVTVSPGETKTFDLQQMVTWPGGRVGDPVSMAFEFSGSAVQASASGDTVTVTAADSARPGTQERATVYTTSHQDVEPASLTFTVGDAPAQLPRGGTASQLCRTTEGNSCDILVVGIAGETNPLPGTPLRLVSVQASQACPGVSFQVASETHVRASWGADTPGATCRARFEVRDAQGRVSGGDAMGTVLLDLHGIPSQPGGVSQIGYDDEQVMLRVDPGASRAAYPALQGFHVSYEGREVATCGADGACPVISAPNGEPRVYTVTAFNSTGPSRGSVQTTAWAYNPPQRPGGASFTPTVTSDGAGLRADITVTGIAANETAKLQLRNTDTGAVQEVGVGGSTVTIGGYLVGSNQPTEVVITPISRWAIPPGLAGVESGESITIAPHGIGAPVGARFDGQPTSSNQGGGQATIHVNGRADPGGARASTYYGFALGGQQCRPTSQSAHADFPGLADGQTYDVTMCVASVFEGRTYGTVSVTQTGVRALQPTTPPQGFTFRVGGSPQVDGEWSSSATARWSITGWEDGGERVPNNNDVVVENYPSSVYNRDPGITVFYRHRDWGTTSEKATMTPAPGSAPYQLSATVSINRCVGGLPLDMALRDSGVLPQGGAAMDVNWDQVRYFATWHGIPFQVGSGQTVPDGATSVEARLSITYPDAANEAYGLRGTGQIRLLAQCSPGAEVDACVGRGGEWDYDNGVCIEPVDPRIEECETQGGTWDPATETCVMPEPSNPPAPSEPPADGGTALAPPTDGGTTLSAPAAPSPPTTPTHRDEGQA